MFCKNIYNGLHNKSISFLILFQHLFNPDKIRLDCANGTCAKGVFFIPFFPAYKKQ